MLALQSALLGVAGVIAILFGFRYALAREFMPYHATVAGRSWSELTLTLGSLLPILYVTLWLRRVQPAAKTPVAPAAFVLLLAVSGSLLALWR